MNNYKEVDRLSQPFRVLFKPNVTISREDLISTLFAYLFYLLALSLFFKLHLQLSLEVDGSYVVQKSLKVQSNPESNHHLRVSCWDLNSP